MGIQKAIYKCWLLSTVITFSAVQEIEAAEAVRSLDAKLQIGPVDGKFIMRGEAGAVFVPSDRNSAAVPVQNAERIAPSAAGPKLEVSGRINPDTQQLEVASYVLDLPNPVPPVANVSKEGYSRLREATEEFKKEVAKVWNARPEDPVPALRRAQDSLEKELARLYDVALRLEDVKLRRDVAQATGISRRQLKAIYGTYDNYRPWSYQQIYTNSRAVVAVGAPLKIRPHCSGVVIANDLVLTAAHCYRDLAPSESEVWFDYTEGRTGGGTDPVRRAIVQVVSPPPSQLDDLFKRAKSERFDREFPDYAIVRFAPALNPVGKDSLSSITPQCVRDTPLRRGDAVYAVGYPKGDRATVHDNARVYLPFRIRQADLQELKRDLEADLHSHTREQVDSLLNTLTASYVPQTINDTPYYLLYDKTMGGQPKVGLVADMFKGDSGAPIFDRDSHCVAGIFVSGAADLETRLSPSLVAHESMIPLSAILENVKVRLGSDAKEILGSIQLR